MSVCNMQVNDENLEMNELVFVVTINHYKYNQFSAHTHPKEISVQYVAQFDRLSTTGPPSWPEYDLHTPDL